MKHDTQEKRNLDGDQRLRWVSANARFRDRAQPMSVMINQCVQRFLAPTSPQETAARHIIEGISDPQFKAHCRFGSLRGGRLEIIVDRPELVAAMRLRWHMDIRDRLWGSAAASAASQIMFRHYNKARTP